MTLTLRRDDTHLIKPWWLQIPVAPRYTYLGYNPDSGSFLWRDATHTLPWIQTWCVTAPSGGTLHIPWIQPWRCMAAHCGATLHITWIQPWRCQLPVAPRYTYFGSNPDSDKSLTLHFSRRTLDPTLTVTTPCGTTLHIPWIQPGWRQVPDDAQLYTYLGSNPDGDNSFWCDTKHTLNPTLIVTAPCGATLHLPLIKPWRWQLPCSEMLHIWSNHYSCSSLLPDATHTLDPILTVTAHCGSMLRTLDPTLILPASCGATLHIPWIQSGQWQLPVARRYTHTVPWIQSWPVTAPSGETLHILWNQPWRWQLTVARRPLPWIQPWR
jgi:hypothetical protein